MSHFQIQNNLISYLCFFDINTSNFQSKNHQLAFLEISISIFISHLMEWVDCGCSIFYYICCSLWIHTLCRVTYLPLWQRMLIH